MFGPNTHLSSFNSISYSHRDNEFFDLYKDTVRRFKSTFSLNDYDVLFIGGSGTIGIESVIYSIIGNIKIIGHPGVFFNRWVNMVNGYNKAGDGHSMYCQLETSNSSYFESNGGIVDCISSFPYYDIPKDADIFITCSNKQLGSYPGLSIVGVKKSFWGSLKSQDTMSYLNLKRYLDYGNKNQTPSTAPTHLFAHLNTILKNMDVTELRSKMNEVSYLITEAVGKDNVIGGLMGPVITINKDAIPIQIANKYQLYGINTNTTNYQIFTYSCDMKYYLRFCKDIQDV